MLERSTKGLTHAARALARAPRFTVIAVLTLALGVGANTAIFSVVEGVLLRPLNYPDSDELVNVWSTAPGLNFHQFALSPDIYYFYRTQTSAFADLAMYVRNDVSLTGDVAPERVPSIAATASLFPTLGVAPQLGRVFTEDEELPHSPGVVVLSHDLWQRRFGGDRGVIGRTMQVEGESREIVGVMPPGFDFPGDVELWIPAGIDPADPPAGSFSYPVIGRLAPGIDAAAAEAQLAQLVPRLIEDRSADYRAFLENGRYAPLVHRMKDDEVGSLERPLWILLGTVAFVLLIACANIANLILIRAEGRRRESAVRTALGATRGALLRQSAAESAIIATVGGALGLLVAGMTMPAVLRLAPPQLPRLDEAGIDGTVLLFTLGVTAVSALLFGVAPLLRQSPQAMLGALKQGGRGGTGIARTRVRHLLVGGQTALALVLLVGVGLLVRSFREARGTDLGFDHDGLLTFRLSLPDGKYGTAAQVTAFHEQLLETLRALPGVESAAMASALPLANSTPGTAFEIETQPTPPGQLPPLIRFKYASPGLLEALRIPLLAGRTIQPSDSRDGGGHVVVDAVLASKFWPGQDAVGKRLRFASDTARWLTVEGVVGRVLEAGVHRMETEPLLYLPMRGPVGDQEWSVRTATYVLRTRAPATLARAARRSVWSVDPDIPVADLRTGKNLVAESLVRMSFTMTILGIAALLALVLGAVGLYGVLSYSVAQRRREIGVRMALGAERSAVAGMVVRDGARITLLGLVVGLAAAAALTRLMRGILFGVEPLDFTTYGVTAGVLLAVAVVAAWLPARRAAAVDPLESMRAE